VFDGVLIGSLLCEALIQMCTVICPTIIVFFHSYTATPLPFQSLVYPLRC